jgi:hypothetical protein
VHGRYQRPHIDGGLRVQKQPGIEQAAKQAGSKGRQRFSDKKNTYTRTIAQTRYDEQTPGRVEGHGREARKDG